MPSMVMGDADLRARVVPHILKRALPNLFPFGTKGIEPYSLYAAPRLSVLNALAHSSKRAVE